MLHCISNVRHVRLLGDSVLLRERGRIQSLHSHLLLDKRHLRLLGVHELLLLFRLILTSLEDSF